MQSTLLAACFRPPTQIPPLPPLSASYDSSLLLISSIESIMALLSFTNITLSLVSLLVARRIYWEVTTGTRRRALAKQHGCLPPKRRPSKKLLFGIDHIMRNFKTYKEHRLLDEGREVLTGNNAHTVFMKILAVELYLTDDPENIKMMLATSFDQWSLGQERIAQMSSYLGDGIFTTEGAAWKHSRDMLRPCFERSQVADVSILEKHTNRLIDLLPKDGTTVDLQPLFHELTLDIATEFLFGQSTNSLDRSKEDKACQQFIEAFEYCQNPFNELSSRFGILGMFLPDSKFKRCAKIIRGMYYFRSRNVTA